MVLRSSSAEVTIGSRKVSPHHRPFIIAELSGNHDGSIERAKELIREAARCGADAVKLQTYTADTMTLNTNRDEFVIKDGLWKGETLYSLFEKAHTPWEWHGELFELARSEGLEVFSSPFDESATDFLESLNVSAYKVASFEMTDLPLVEHIAKKGKPIIASTGMASREEIRDLVTVVNKYHSDLILLHCVSAYPTPESEMNLRRILTLKEEFGLQTGLSDHSLGTLAAEAAASLGATVIEKHFILNRNDGGPDCAFSIEPPELRELVDKTSRVFEALGSGELASDSRADEKSKIFRRSLIYSQNLNPGDTVTTENVRRVRPGHGLDPKFQDEIIGKTLIRPVQLGDGVSFEDFGRSS